MRFGRWMICCAVLAAWGPAQAEAPTPAQRAKLKKVVAQEQLGRALEKQAILLPSGPRGEQRFLIPVLNTWVKPAALTLYVVGAGRPKPLPDPRGPDAKQLRLKKLLGVTLVGVNLEVRAQYQRRKEQLERTAVYVPDGPSFRLAAGPANSSRQDLAVDCQPLALLGGWSAKLCAQGEGQAQLSLTSASGPVYTQRIDAATLERLSLIQSDPRVVAIQWEGAECSGVRVLRLADQVVIADLSCDNSRYCQVKSLPSEIGCVGSVVCTAERGEAPPPAAFDLCR